jgi:urea transport system ATP-binding protein
VEQYLEFAKRLADSYAIMEKGSIVSEGTMRELREDVVKRYLTV